MTSSSKLISVPNSGDGFAGWPVGVGVPYTSAACASDVDKSAAAAMRVSFMVFPVLKLSCVDAGCEPRFSRLNALTTREE